MKILHTSDLHIGKRVNEYSMLDEQKFILEQIVTIAEAEQPNAIILAGDIYDKNIPSAEAVTLFDVFWFRLPDWVRTYSSSAAIMILPSASPSLLALWK